MFHTLTIETSWDSVSNKTWKSLYAQAMSEGMKYFETDDKENLSIQINTTQRENQKLPYVQNYTSYITITYEDRKKDNLGSKVGGRSIPVPTF